VQRNPVTSPPAPDLAIRHAMAYDADRQRVVLFGRGSAFFSETWEWDGTTWLQRLPVTSPPARLTGNAMAYDAARQRLVLFNGHNAVVNDEIELHRFDPHQGHAQRAPAGRVCLVRSAHPLFGAQRDLHHLEPDGFSVQARPHRAWPVTTWLNQNIDGNWIIDTNGAGNPNSFRTFWITWSDPSHSCFGTNSLSRPTSSKGGRGALLWALRPF
jgi:hypothetical protein